MKEEQKLTGAIQENLLTLLCFDQKYASIIRHSITARVFESQVFRDIADKAIAFLEQFKVPIGEHLADELEDILAGDDKRKATSYKRVLENLFLAKDHVNGEYAVSQLSKFVRQQNLKSSLVKAVEAIEDGRIDDAEVVLQAGLKSQVVTFDAGLSFTDVQHSLAFFDTQEHGILTGIEELDIRDICPRPAELYLVIAPPKRGKTWWLIQMGKFALLQRKKVLHITLEMADYRISMRYTQSFFSISKRQALIRTPKLIREDGRVVDIDFEEIERMTFADPDARKKIAGRINREFRRRPELKIKQFPTGSLTISQLNAYLDGLERFHKFIPDVLIIDYPDLMKLNNDNLRAETGAVYKDLRGIAMERNIAVIAASQGNRTSSKAKILTDDMVAEDYSKIATADNVITYSQTPHEKKLGLARIFVSNGRNDEDKFSILITQAYAVGQFCLDSAMLPDDYWMQVDSQAGGTSRDGSD